MALEGIPPSYYHILPGSGLGSQRDLVRSDYSVIVIMMLKHDSKGCVLAMYVWVFLLLPLLTYRRRPDDNPPTP